MKNGLRIRYKHLLHTLYNSSAAINTPASINVGHLYTRGLETIGCPLGLRWRLAHFTVGVAKTELQITGLNGPPKISAMEA